VCRAGERYYLANSTFEYFPGLPIHVSDDLVTWTPLTSAITDVDAFDYARLGDSKGVYAPSIRFHDGVFYIACALVDGGVESGFIITATDPAGPWSKPVWVREARGFDPSLFFHEERTYWCAARTVQPGEYFGQTEVWVREIDPTSGEFLGDETVIWDSALRGATWSEAPHIFERDGWFYLLTAEAGTFRDHAVVIGRSRSITGPYENCPRNPIFSHRHLGTEYPVQNVGHADFVERPDGTWCAVALAVRTIDDKHILGRETFIADVTWEDDWPVVNAGTGVLLDVGDRPHDERVEPARLGDALTIRGAADFVTEVADGMVLTSTGSSVTQHEHPAALAYRLRHHDAVVSATFGSVDDEAITGLLLRQSTDFSIRLELAHARARVIRRSDGSDEVVDEWPTTSVGGEITAGSSAQLSAQLSAQGVRFAVGDHWSRSTPIDVLSTEMAGGFVGTVWGPYVEGAEGATALVSATEYRGGTA
jgi:alpha-N-arabinofuranosidase